MKLPEKHSRCGKVMQPGLWHLTRDTGLPGSCPVWARQAGRLPAGSARASAVWNSYAQQRMPCCAQVHVACRRWRHVRNAGSILRGSPASNSHDISNCELSAYKICLNIEIQSIQNFVGVY